jgi:hypothetical protein
MILWNRIYGKEVSLKESVASGSARRGGRWVNVGCWRAATRFKITQNILNVLNAMLRSS